MPGDSAEKKFPRLEFLKLHYSSAVVENLTKEKGSFEIIFPFSPNIFYEFFSPNGCQVFFNPLSAEFIKSSNTLKQIVGKLPTICLSVFDHFSGLAFKGLNVYIRIVSFFENLLILHILKIYL